MKPFLRSEYNYDMNDASDASGLACKDKTKAQQQFAEEVDINTIVRRFNLTGQLPENVRMPTYADYDELFDFHSAMNAIRQATEAFNAMPARIRARFHNDPAELVEFCSDENNLEEAQKLGLVNPKQAEATLPPTPAAAAPAAAPAAPVPSGAQPLKP